MLKISDVVPVYIRIAQIIGVGSDAVSYGVRAKGDNSVVEMNGNYLFFTRYAPISGIDKTLISTLNVMNLNGKISLYPI